MQASLVCVRLKWLNIWDPPRAEWKPVGDTRLLGVWSVGVVRYATIVKGIMDIEDMVYKTNYFIISSYGYTILKYFMYVGLTMKTYTATKME